jgi:hypothetical protein
MKKEKKISRERGRSGEKERKIKWLICGFQSSGLLVIFNNKPFYSASLWYLPKNHKLQQSPH